jgi:hypothetical protein
LEGNIMNHRYIAGPAEKLQELFPPIRDQDKRSMPDRKTIVEVDLDDFKLASMQADADLTVMTHEEALNYVNQFQSNTGIGRESVAPARAKNVSHKARHLDPG